MPISRRGKAIYLALTVAFLLAAIAFAAFGIWVVALATVAMGGVMTAAARQMRTPPRTANDDRSPDAPS